MADTVNGSEEIIIPTETQPVEKHSRADERIGELSEKVKTTAQERDALKTSNESVTRERDYYKEFSEVVAQNPAAKDFQDDIKDKVMKGYTVEDATFAVLGKAGKLGQTVQAPRPNVAGGSADTSPQSGQKEVKDMSQAERRAQLEKDLMWS